MKTLALILAHNEEKNIAKVIERTLKQDIDKIVVVDDGSTDKTPNILLQLSKKLKNKIKVVRHKENKGYGGAQKSLLIEAIKEKTDLTVILHGDGQHSPEEIPILLDPLKKRRADVVLGSRALGDMLGGGMPFHRFVGNKVLTFLENLAFGMKLTTYHSGYRACTVRALENINFQSFTNDYYFDSEFLVAVHEKKLRLVEVPITTNYSENSPSGVTISKYAFQILSLILRYRLKKLKRIQIR